MVVKDDCKQRDIDIHQATEMTQHCSAWSLEEPGEAAYARIRVATAISKSYFTSLTNLGVCRSV